jgi:hypothetical protein
LLLDYAKKNIGSTPKYDTLMEWMKAWYRLICGVANVLWV